MTETRTDAMQTDSDWEHLAKADAYWAVLTHEEFRRKNLNEQSRASFFASGEEEIRDTFAALRAQVDPAFSPQRALDFGCGVGRLSLPLSQRCAEVVGVDVSDTMLREAAANCQISGVRNVTLVKGDDELSGVGGLFDLVHTYIVLQHVPVERGTRIFRRLVELVKPGGCGAIHITYASPVFRCDPPPEPPPPPERSRLNLLARAVLRPIVRPIRQRLLARRVPTPAPTRPVKLSAPEMQMNEYSLNVLFRILQDARVERFHTQFTNHGGWCGVQLFFRKDERK